MKPSKKQQQSELAGSPSMATATFHERSYSSFGTTQGYSTSTITPSESHLSSGGGGGGGNARISDTIASTITSPSPIYLGHYPAAPRSMKFTLMNAQSMTFARYFRQLHHFLGDAHLDFTKSPVELFRQISSMMDKHSKSSMSSSTLDDHRTFQSMIDHYNTHLSTSSPTPHTTAITSPPFTKAHRNMQFFSQLTENDAIMHVISLSSYDELDNDGNNQLIESLKDLHAIVRSPLLAAKPLIVVVNKVDVFVEKIKTVPLSKCFDRYQEKVHLPGFKKASMAAASSTSQTQGVLPSSSFAQYPSSLSSYASNLGILQQQHGTSSVYGGGNDRSTFLHHTNGPSPYTSFTTGGKSSLEPTSFRHSQLAMDTAYQQLASNTPSIDSLLHIPPRHRFPGTPNITSAEHADVVDDALLFIKRQIASASTLPNTSLTPTQVDMETVITHWYMHAFNPDGTSGSPASGLQCAAPTADAVSRQPHRTPTPTSSSGRRGNASATSKRHVSSSPGDYGTIRDDNSVDGKHKGSDTPPTIDRIPSHHLHKVDSLFLSKRLHHLQLEEVKSQQQYLSLYELALQQQPHLQALLSSSSITPHQLTPFTSSALKSHNGNGIGSTTTTTTTATTTTTTGTTSGGSSTISDETDIIEQTRISLGLLHKIYRQILLHGPLHPPFRLQQLDLSLPLHDVVRFTTSVHPQHSTQSGSTPDATLSNQWANRPIVVVFTSVINPLAVEELNILSYLTAEGLLPKLAPQVIPPPTPPTT